MLEFRLLGAVEAVRNGDHLPLGGRRQRALLALLLLERGRPVSRDRLVDELWHGQPPTGVSTTLRSYVSRLRAVLGSDAPVTTGAAGYALEVPPETVDVHRFERLTREGEAALARGRAQRARERSYEALELWRGRPFAELADEGALHAEAERLEELRLLALESRLEAELALGAGTELVEELEALVRTHPYRERFWRQLMLALYRSERQADALAAYRRARDQLDRELGIEPSEELKRLHQAILRHEVPVEVASGERHNLPTPVTSFVGRETDLARLERLLAEARLVTLTGVGGVGKTRLAQEAAARALPDFADGVFFVDFAPLADPALVPRHVGAALAMSEQPDAPADEQLARRLRDADLLLVLDNCEHLRDTCASLARELLEGCPSLRILATSREVLGVAGEVDVSVPPLALPAADADEAENRSSEAVRLFVTRARESRSSLEEAERVFATAARICRDLDGLPLAIELAAARAKALSLEEIAARLDDRFRFLVSWRRLTAARHRTLREAMDWSYELLASEEQELLARLSVFAGGFTLAAAAAVCLEGDGERALNLTGRLVDASLVVAGEQDGAMRYHLLETVRQYAAVELERAGAAEAARRAHADWCLALAEEAEPQLTGEQQTRWFASLDREMGNLRSALTYLGAAGESELRLRLTIALSRFWYVRGHLSDAREALERALVDTEEQSPGLRRRALTAAAAVALLQGDHASSTAFAERALAIAREDGDPRFVANGLSNLGAIVLAAGDRARAGELLEEAVVRAREAGDIRIAALAINNLGDLALTLGDYERAEPLFDESLELLRARGDTANIARSLFNLGAVALQLERPEDARARFRESLTLAEEAGDKEDLAWCLEGIAAFAATEGRGEPAGLLLGAAEAVIEGMGAARKPFEQRLYEIACDRARDLCGADAFTAAIERGTQLELREALAHAHAALSAS